MGKPTKSGRVEGLVTKVGSGSADGGTTWEQSFVLCPWREPGGALSKEPFRLTVVVRESKLEEGELLEGKAISGTFRERAPPPAKGEKAWTAVGRKPLTVIPVKPFLAAAPKRARRPPKVRDPVLGNLRVEEGQLTVWRSLRGRPYELLIGMDDPDRESQVIARARAVVKQVERELVSLRGRIADKKLALCNRWRKQAEAKPVSRAAFIRALRLASLSVQDTESSLIFECGDLFEDHGLEVCLNAKGQVGTIDLA